MNYPSHAGTSNAPSNSSDQNRKIFLGGLSYHTTDETLRKFCSRFGSFTDCLVMRTSEGKSRGFGFVTYETEQSVEEFMRARPHTIDSRQIDPKRAMPREDQNRSEAHLTVKKLFVAGLRDGIDENVLREYFGRFGTVTEVLSMKERDGKPRGFAFVSFDDYDSVDKAILAKPHVVNGRPLDIKKAIPKEKMQEMGYPTPHGSNHRSGGHGPPRNDYPSPSIKDDPYSNNWDDQIGMNRMGNPNPNYNQPPMPSYPTQGYGSNGPSYNQTMSSTSSAPYPSSYSTNMGQNPGTSMMNYEQYNPPPPPLAAGNNNANLSAYPHTSNTMTNSNYIANSSMPPYNANPPSGYNSMNNPFNPQPVPPSSRSAYNDGPIPSNSYGNPTSYGINSQNYDGNDSSLNYNNMSGSSRAGGPMRGGRGNGGYHGNNSGSSYGQRQSPYPNRGGRGGGRGRGRGQ